MKKLTFLFCLIITLAFTCSCTAKPPPAPPTEPPVPANEPTGQPADPLDQPAVPLDRLPDTVEDTPAIIQLESSPSSHLTYTTTGDIVTITGYTGEDNNVAIPAEIEGKSVTHIGDEAFFELANITSVTVPASIISIGSEAFLECKSLLSINVAGDNTVFTSQDGVLFSKDKTELIYYPYGKQGAYTIPGSVMTVGNWAFSDCVDLTSVEIPTSVTNIGWRAFNGCISLESITIPLSVSDIGDEVFIGCDNLTVICPSGSYAQEYCEMNGINYTLQSN